VSSAERWRCFVSVALDDALRGALDAAMAGWREDPRTEGLRWVAPEALHVTLAFLGSVAPDSIGAIKTGIEQVAARHAPTEHATGRLGAFARPGSARVLWYAVDDRDGSLSAIATDLEGALGLDPGEPHRAHVTLARARHRWVDLRGWIEDASEAAPEGTLAVRRLDLMRSHLGAGPARYETLETFPLGADR
jgi:RNA 2',3'-cyclic 3'-phosphodiesterase